jgi:hypothetical protein
MQFLKGVSRKLGLIIGFWLIFASIPASAQWGATYVPPRSSTLLSPLNGVDARTLHSDRDLQRDEVAELQMLTEGKRAAEDTNGLGIDGYLSYTYNTNTGRLRLLVDRVSNNNATRTSGTLRLSVWFSTQAFPSPGYRTATYSLGQLSPNYYFYNIDSGDIPFTTPPTGCYFVTVLLEEWSGAEWFYVDFVETSPKQGINTTCNVTPPPTCVPDSTTLCMLNNRFRVRLRYRNQFSNPAQTGYLLGRSFASSSSAESSVFWFSDDKNVEYIVKLYDVRPFENKIHLASGAVTDIETWLEVTDTKYNISRSYNKGPGDVIGFFDRTTYNP